MRRIALALLVSLLFASGCKKYDGPAPKEPAPQPSAEAAEATPEPEAEEEEREPTFAEKAKALVAKIDRGVETCVREHMDKMDMGKLEDGFLPINLNRMDKACRAPIEDYKRFGHELLGHVAELDTALRPVATFSDAYLRMSLRFKQLGAPERWKVVAQIEESRSRTLSAVAEIRRGAEVIAKWPDDLSPDERVLPEGLEASAYRARAGELAAWLGENLPRLVEDYRSFGFQPAEIQEAIYYFSFRFAYFTTKRWYELHRKRFEALRCEGGKECARTADDMRVVLEAADRIVESYGAGLRFYKGDYFKRLDDAVRIEKDMTKHLKDLTTAIRKARL